MTVYLVGAGPGDPGLLTLRAAEVLGVAEVVVHDRLAAPAILDLAPVDAERIDVGKSPGSPVAQDEINQILLRCGGEGREVVRLKGGDPFVFGRGGEEALALQAAGIPFEIVPGITSAIAAPAYAGVPVTHRGRSTSFTVVTGHTRHAVDNQINWPALAAAGGTIVVLMGVAHRDAITAGLLAGGLAPNTPVCTVTWGTRPAQRTVRTTLAGLPAAAVNPPATIVIGEVAGLDLSWYDQRPLFGRTVVVTRAAGQAPALSTGLRHLGAEPLEVPVIAIGDPSDGGAGLARAADAIRAGTVAWAVFTSVNAVDRLGPLVPDGRQWAGIGLAAIGPGTAAALHARGLPPDLVPERSVAEGLLDRFPAPDTGGGTVLVARAATGRDVLPDGLRSLGWTVDLVEAYRTRPVVPSTGALDAAASADAICFTSSSTVTAYLAAAGPDRMPPAVITIGPATSATARVAGLHVTTEADPHTIGGVVDAVLRTLGRDTGEAQSAG